MENNTKAKEVIYCGFCETELKRGVHVCRTCFATVRYGVPPGWALALVFLIGIVGGVFAVYSTHLIQAFFFGFIGIVLVGFVIIKSIYADNVTFFRR